MKRFIDVVLAATALVVLSIPIAFAALLVKFTSSGPVIFWSDRVGRNNELFRMPKFRTMRVDTPAVATHLLGDPSRFLTPAGSFMRKTSIDELPQLWSILRGDMGIARGQPCSISTI